jgi:tetrahydromethanopterin S-methyltransferase subunit E
MEIDVVFSNKSQFGIKNDYNSCYLATQYGESVIKGICMQFVANGNNLSVMK